MESVEGTIGSEPKREQVTRVVGVGGSAIEALAGLAAVVLSIFGLSGRIVVPFASVAMIATGGALLFEAAAVAARAERAHLPGPEIQCTALESAIGADSIAGLAAITLGILALVGIEPITLLPVGAIVLGAGLLLSAGGPIVERGGGGRRADDVGRDARAAASGVHVLVGAGALVLGIIAVLGDTPILMTLIATLSIGAAQLLSGVSIGGRMATLLRQGS